MRILAGKLKPIFQYFQYLNIPNIGILVGRLEPMFQYFQYLNIFNIRIFKYWNFSCDAGTDIPIFPIFKYLKY